MEQSPLGRSKLMVSRMGLGCMGLSEAAPATIRKACAVHPIAAMKALNR